MIETVLLEYLQENLDVSVYLEVPDNEETEFIVFEKTSSGEENHICTATVAIQSYSDSMYNAAVLNDTVKAVMDVFSEQTEICKCQLNSDYNYTDTSTKRYRYQAVYDITHYKNI